MTKQHLVALAAAINTKFALTSNPADFNSRAEWQKDMINAAIEIVSEVAAQFNPKFDEARFRTACFAA